MTSRRGSRTGQRERWLTCLLVVIWIAAFAATHVPKGKVPETHVRDTTLHVIGYFVLGGLFGAALIVRGVRRLRRVGIALVVFGVYAALDEITQPLVNRHASIQDWLADMIGLIAALLVCELLATLRERRKTCRRKE